MPLDNISKWIADKAAVQRSLAYKIGAVLVGMLIFLILVPALFYLIGIGLDRYVLQTWATYLTAAFAWICIIVGLGIAGWAMLSQAIKGKGTPAPIAATQELVVSGPYKFTRNPIQLGVMIYYMGLGTWFGSLTVGLVMFFIAFVIGSLFHKFVEEKELQMRFGEQYELYKEKTPFLIPKIWT